MRLVCQLDEGPTLDIQAATRRQPYQVRALLIDALSGPDVPPDSVDLLEAEQGIRRAVADFPGDDDKIVRSYILNRLLDNRNQIIRAPAHQLFASAVLHGGPLALIGIHYATVNAHRNPHHRAVLNCVSNLVSEESRLDLFKRTNDFPSNPSFDRWLHRLWEKVDLDTLSIGCLLSCFGAKAIHKSVFERCRVAARTWGPDGEAFETNPHHASLMLDQSAFDASLQKLEIIGIVKMSYDSIRVNLRLLRGLQARPQIFAWRLEAVRAVFHAIPKHKALETGSYTRQIEIILPLLQHLFQQPIDENVLSAIRLKGDIYVAAEALLSASYFGELRWKQTALDLVGRFLEDSSGLTPSEHALLRARAGMRRAQITHLVTPRPLFQVETIIQYPIANDPRANAYAIEIALIRCRDFMRQNKLDLAQQAIQYQPGPGQSLSTLEALKYEKLRFMQAIVYRFAGQFADAREILLHFPQSDPRTLSYASATMCELGEHERAIEKLHGWLQLSSTLFPAAKRRVELSLANAYIMKAMQAYKRGNREEGIFTSLITAQEIYNRIGSDQLLPWFDRMSIRVGKAIVLHLKDSQEEAIQAWHSVRYLIREYELAPAYLDMIAAYATGELELRRGEATASDILLRRANLLFRETGRQYYFTGLGSLWPSIVDDWVLKHGGEPILSSSPSLP
ncbi:hypothetical protein F5Y10DRAFT_259330 [Nemania abortiva]|nr:hypothetical protein F5Y10DRAFT_259330 [Nemania abortiva]